MMRPEGARLAPPQRQDLSNIGGGATNRRAQPACSRPPATFRVAASLRFAARPARRCCKGTHAPSPSSVLAISSQLQSLLMHLANAPEGTRSGSVRRRPLYGDSLSVVSPHDREQSTRIQHHPSNLYVIDSSPATRGDTAIADSADERVSSMAALLHRDRLKAWW